MGSNTLIQGALPEILENTPQTFFDDVNMTLYVSFHLNLISCLIFIFSGTSLFLPFLKQFCV